MSCSPPRPPRQPGCRQNLPDRRATGFRRLSYDRMQESEADHIGVFLMAFAGYDPARAAEFWDRMARARGPGPPEFLSDHPTAENRARALREWVPRARAAKRAFDEGRIAPPR